MNDVYFTHLEVTAAFDIEERVNFLSHLEKEESFLFSFRFWEEGLSHSAASEGFDCS